MPMRSRKSSISILLLLIGFTVDDDELEVVEALEVEVVIANVKGKLAEVGIVSAAANSVGTLNLCC
jgi:hypothetical protein